MPLPVLDQRMSAAELDAEPFLLGWKSEYYNGVRRLRLSGIAVVRFRLALTPVAPPSRVTRRPSPDDAADLVALFLDSFAESVDYAGWSPVDRLNAAQRSIESFFANDTSRRDQSAVGLDEGQIVAAALIRDDPEGSKLRPLFVRADRQRQGWGQAVFAAARNALHAAGVERLLSECHLANTASMAWHLHQGFVEQPDPWIAQCRAQYHHLEGERLARQGDHEQAKLHAELATIYFRLGHELEELRYERFRQAQAATDAGENAGLSGE
jgi:GNAT superfamily N-acetyltransferase